jgi:RNA polymerase sigma factor (sigma-70 family)
MSEITNSDMQLAKQVGWQVGRRWPSIEIEDLRQHLILWLFEHVEQVSRFRERENGKAQLALSLKREALRYCTKESAERQGKSVERNDFYTEEVIERALPFLFQAGFEMRVRQDPNTGRAVDRQFDTGDARAIMSDLQRAYKSLPPQNAMVLELRYQEDLTLEDVGRRLEMSKQAIEQSVARSVSLMSQYLSR